MVETFHGETCHGGVGDWSRGVTFFIFHVPYWRYLIYIHAVWKKEAALPHLFCGFASLATHYSRIQGQGQNKQHGSKSKRIVSRKKNLRQQRITCSMIPERLTWIEP